MFSSSMKKVGANLFYFSDREIQVQAYRNHRNQDVREQHATCLFLKINSLNLSAVQPGATAVQNRSSRAQGYAPIYCDS